MGCFLQVCRLCVVSSQYPRLILTPVGHGRYGRGIPACSQASHKDASGDSRSHLRMARLGSFTQAAPFDRPSRSASTSIGVESRDDVARSDVVPVLNATRNLWTHDPYGGEYDAETGFIWGRGSSDDKSGTIGVMSAVELLLKSGKFTPDRTVILSFGIDEETGGKVARRDPDSRYS